VATRNAFGPDRPTTTGRENGAGPLFCVERLRYRYPQAQDRAVDDVSFTVAEGEIFGFLGPSGAGKSTTQKILIRLLRDYEGRIAYRGADHRSLGNDFYQEIGVGFETPIAFSKLTALETWRSSRSSIGTAQMLSRCCSGWGCGPIRTRRSASIPMA